ncbi:DUF6377 domain-containing protein [Gaetbulibacter sp. NE]|uniref:DUF6377 domain-containing protein n=1 Tax=Gaetbulibacter sp. NE TaxID=2982307 RepID=UPI0021D1FB62|nr:DUF6377 domain-containing protein [Gaetbulibacter sp. NE]
MNRVLFVLLFICNLLFSNNERDSLFSKLDAELQKKSFYDSQKEKRIKLLIKESAEADNLLGQYQIFDQIFEEYKFYHFDEALKYIEKNIQIGEKLDDELFFNQAKLKLGLLLVNSGRYKESIDALNEIKRDSLPETILNDYYIAYKEGYSGLSYYTKVTSNKSNYTQLYLAYQDSLYSRLKADSEEALRLKEKEYRDNRNLKMAIKVNDQRLSEADEGSRLYSLITFERSLLYELENNIAEQRKYLILSAISDIKASVKDNASLGTLAKILFIEGDLDRAHLYINFSYSDAEFYNSQLRFVNIANTMPLISKAYEEKTEKQKKKLEYSLIFISVLAAFLIIAIYVVYNQVKKVSIAKNELKVSNENLNKLNIELSELDQVKEHYIGSFLNLYSEYITKLDVYRKLVSKYVKANQMNALLDLSKSKQMIDEELEIFNKNFDSSFLHMHPDFVESVNSLLKEGDQIQLSKNDQLNTELRILALIKLGITSSSKIAKILRYSVNTIYNYRAAIKSMAKDKTSFEDLIKKIK